MKIILSNETHKVEHTGHVFISTHEGNIKVYSDGFLVAEYVPFEMYWKSAITDHKFKDLTLRFE